MGAERAELGRIGVQIGVGEGDHVRQQHGSRKVAALKQGARRDPRAPLAPARDGRRIEQRLPEVGGRAIEIRHAGRRLQAEAAIGGDDQFDRPLDMRADRGRTVEVAR